MEAQTNEKRTKVLLSFVGNRDPWPSSEEKPEEIPESCPEGPDGEGAILELCKCLHPDILYLFPSGKKGNEANNTERRAERIREILATRSPDLSCRILPMNVQDATDFEQLSVALEENVDVMLRGLGETVDSAEFHFNCSSGTPQMTALAYVFVNTGRISGCVLQQCKAPNYKPRVREVKATFLAVNEYIKKARANIENLSFLTARANCLELSKVAATLKQRDVSRFLAKLFSVYNYMDILRYESASAVMHEVSNMPVRHFLRDEHRTLLMEQSRMLAALNNSPFENERDKKGRKETPENLLDLYFNMQRCFLRGAYADVLSRFWRICEGSVYYRLESIHGVNPRDLQNSRKDSLAKLQNSQEGRRFEPNAKYSRQFLGLDHGRYALLHVLDVGVFGGDFDNFFEVDVKKMTIERNNVIVAHGMDQVGKDAAEKCAQYAERLLCTLIPSLAKEIAKYPFREDVLRSWGALL